LIMADHEGFWKNSRSHDSNNPGNIGNTDNGKNKHFATLKEGIEAQINYFHRILNGTAKAFPIGKQVNLKPYFSDEIARNWKTYRMSPYVPGYSFVFTGQLDQFIKIYATGPRLGNEYLSEIIQFFANHGIKITGTTTLQEIAKIV